MNFTSLLYAGLEEIHQLLKMKHQLPGSLAQLSKMSSLQQAIMLLTQIHIVSSTYFPPSFLTCFRASFSVPCVVLPQPGTESLASRNSLQIPTHGRIRVNSSYLRELSFGKCIINYKNLTQLDYIGQGTHCVSDLLNFNQWIIVNTFQGSLGLFTEPNWAVKRWLSKL